AILRGEKALPNASAQPVVENEIEEAEGDTFERHIRRITDRIEQSVKEATLGIDATPFQSQLEHKNHYPAQLPSDSRLEIQSLEPGLYIKHPRGSGAHSPPGIVAFPIAWLGFVFFWTSMTLRMRAPIFFPLFSIPFWIIGITMAKAIISPRLVDHELFITQDGLLLKSKGFLTDHAEQYPLADIGRAKVATSSFQINGRHLRELSIDTGTKKIVFGQGLSERELLYLEKKINEALDHLRTI
ncbi:MAG: hypothetical protein N3A02_01730, partial [Rectinema sp.]|nr:hypothetical protein [Rectinema sp.]